eukprot:TRINITY_DN7202_c0_g2_i1.p1 TRINITY_DN7202_c0_g2~~TRINITY_DN7202_c0_g2_i1.p1  ORF type:complete len:190 (+),score=72.93 TRINITY_DN7202_c0_g2_i1:95-664(+)
MQQRLKNGVYQTSEHFIADGRKFWNNVMGLSQPGTALRSESMEMAKYFEELVNKLGNVPLVETGKNPQKSSKGHGGKKTAGNRKSATERPLSSQEKTALKQNIMKLPQEDLQGIIDIIQSSVDTSKSTETLEFDIDKLPVSVSRALDEYVKGKLPNLKKGARKEGRRGEIQRQVGMGAAEENENGNIGG